MLKYILVLVVLMGFEEISVSQYKLQSDLRLKETNVLYKVNPEFSRKEKSPVLSGFLSFMLPGAALGQFENEQYLDGAIRLMVSAISAIWFLKTAYFYDVSREQGPWQPNTALVIYAANWLSSVVDAVIYAAANNRHLKKQSGLNLNLGYDLHGVKMKAVLDF